MLVSKHRALSPREEEHLVEWMKCEADPAYFINTYCKIFDSAEAKWISFELWAGQYKTLEAIHRDKLTIVLKARQLGLTWLCLSYALWLMLFKPVAAVLLFSRRDDDATYLLSDERLRGIYKNLPRWMQTEKVVSESSHYWKLSNGSTAKAFPTTGGDSYTATLVVVDEADLIPDLNKLLRSAKPTIDSGGKMVLISRVDKSEPESEFKRIYRSARDGKNGWTPIFLPWSTRITRTVEWYEEQKLDIMERTGSLDDLWEQYPQTDEQALSPRSLDKRIPPKWLLECYHDTPRLDHDGPTLQELNVYFKPNERRGYVLGCDPAEGNPTSDDSALTVLDVESGGEVASLAGKFEPAVFANIISVVSAWYCNAPALIERNNHGHAVILWLNDNSQVDVLLGMDAKQGWLSNSKGKAIVYDSLTEAIRDQKVLVRSKKTYSQLSSIEGSTLRAPTGMSDDLAMSFALAYTALVTGGVMARPFKLKLRW